MKRVVDNPDSPGGDDELDALLGAFFKAELSRARPAFAPPHSGRPLSRRPAKRTGRFAFGSRLALAASVLLLLLSGWLLSGKFPSTPVRPDNPSLGGPGGADSKHRLPILPLPDPLPEPRPAPGKVKSKLMLEQGKDGTGIRIDVEEIPSSK